MARVGNERPVSRLLLPATWVGKADRQIVLSVPLLLLLIQSRRILTLAAVAQQPPAAGCRLLGNCSLPSLRFVSPEVCSLRGHPSTPVLGLGLNLAILIGFSIHFLDLIYLFRKGHAFLYGCSVCCVALICVAYRSIQLIFGKNWILLCLLNLYWICAKNICIINTQYLGRLYLAMSLVYISSRSHDRGLNFVNWPLSLCVSFLN